VFQTNVALADLVAASEDRLISLVLGYAKRQGYTRYTSTLEEAWRLSISGLSASLVEALQADAVPELFPDERFDADPISEFGVLEARRHRERGVSLSMFLGLFKYYRQAFVDLAVEGGLDDGARRWIDRCFDRMEIAFTAEWAQLGERAQIEELQDRNRAMTNEKNRLLTVVESLSSPAILIDESHRVIYQNAATSTLASRTAEYYQAPANPFQRSTEAAADDAEEVTDLFPWLDDPLEAFHVAGAKHLRVEVGVGEDPETQRHYAVDMARMRDVSGKYPGTVILISDLTVRRRAEEQVRRLNRRLQSRNEELTAALSHIDTLEGILPICSSCKKIRDEADRWVAVEVYVRDRTRAEFSHGICPECRARLYPDEPR
jgi:PAS domain-containing protein